MAFNSVVIHGIPIMLIIICSIFASLDYLQGTSSEIFPPDILEAYKYTFSRPNALTAAVNYYRCMMNSKKKKNQEESLKKTTVPTLIIWVLIYISTFCCLKKSYFIRSTVKCLNAE